MSKIIPPKAEKQPKTLNIHNDNRIDNYYWLNEKTNPKVIDYLNQENYYTENMMAHTKAFQDVLFNEMKMRIKEEDSSVPYKYNGYWYITRYETGKDYPIYIRKKETLDADELLLFDCNQMAENHNYFKLSGISISPDNCWASYGIDITGNGIYTIYIKNLKTNQILPDVIKNTTGSATWANDNKTLFYTKKAPKTLRADKIYKHQLGKKNDILVYQETDTTFGTYVFKTKSRHYIIIGSYSTTTSEYRFLEAHKPDADFKIFQPRIRGLEYSIEHYQNHFYILTNADKAYNFKLMKTPCNKTEKVFWESVFPHREDVLLEDIDIFKDYLVVSERQNGLNKIRIMCWDGTEDYYLPFKSETYTAYTSINVEFETDLLRYSYNALTTPASVMEFNMKTKRKTILKEQDVLDKSFDKNNYTSERIWAIAEDGSKIPISLVYKTNLKQSEGNPLLLYGYGAYGQTIDPYFSTLRLSLLNRGFIYAIAHVRGGEYLGRNWYEQGRLFNKKNTFTDFIACSKYLIEKKYTSPKQHYAMGSSAGGLLIGAVINKAPELYNGIITSVPFVDVLTTMLDDSLPLTTGEYDEWGNPNLIDYYTYIKSYSPYDNIKPQTYPHILVTTGLHDANVQYFEPVKWVAKLRELKTDTHKLLIKINMNVGHSGASGRFETLKEVALEYAFLLDLEGVNK